MIQDKETLDAFGYLPTALTYGSKKHIIVTCDNCGEARTVQRRSYFPLCKSCAHKGNTCALGFKHTNEAKEAIRAANIGAKNPAWKDGISFEPYCVKFNEAFKNYIRQKFGYVCFLCPTTQEENGQALSVHHISYNKDCGCDGDKTCNFVPLCIRCHAKTNGNREYWEKLITDKLHRTIIGWNV